VSTSDEDSSLPTAKTHVILISNPIKWNTATFTDKYHPNTYVTFRMTVYDWISGLGCTAYRSPCTNIISLVPEVNATDNEKDMAYTQQTSEKI